MKLTRMAVYRPVVALTVTLALTLFGIMSYVSLGLEQNPELNLPFVTVTAVYPGASAQTVEEQVTRPLEDAISSLGGIKSMQLELAGEPVSDHHRVRRGRERRHRGV